MNITKDIKKLAPWNWFKHEEQEGTAATTSSVPVNRGRSLSSLSPYYSNSPLAHLHEEMDRLFESVFQGFGSVAPQISSNLIMRPEVDISANDKGYTIKVDVPGVEEDDVKLELKNDTLIISGERKQESEEKDEEYYRVERSYGSFRRVLSLPEDADQDNISAEFKNGVLKISLPRKAAEEEEVKRIEIKTAA